jgi:GNAT superfamily N-acetyltransferase
VNSIEIKTLFLADSQNQSGKGFGTALLNRVIDYAHGKPGDVVFFNHRREIRVVVEYVHKYDDFRSMLRYEVFRECYQVFLQ